MPPKRTRSAAALEEADEEPVSKRTRSSAPSSSNNRTKSSAPNSSNKRMSVPTASKPAPSKTLIKPFFRDKKAALKARKELDEMGDVVTVARPPNAPTTSANSTSNRPSASKKGSNEQPTSRMETRSSKAKPGGSKSKTVSTDAATKKKTSITRPDIPALPSERSYTQPQRPISERGAGGSAINPAEHTTPAVPKSSQPPTHTLEAKNIIENGFDPPLGILNDNAILPPEARRTFAEDFQLTKGLNKKNLNDAMLRFGTSHWQTENVSRSECRMRQLSDEGTNDDRTVRLLVYEIVGANRVSPGVICWLLRWLNERRHEIGTVCRDEHREEDADDGSAGRDVSESSVTEMYPPLNSQDKGKAKASGNVGGEDTIREDDDQEGSSSGEESWKECSQLPQELEDDTADSSNEEETEVKKMSNEEFQDLLTAYLERLEDDPEIRRIWDPWEEIDEPGRFEFLSGADAHLGRIEVPEAEQGGAAEFLRAVRECRFQLSRLHPDHVNIIWIPESHPIYETHRFEMEAEDDGLKRTVLEWPE